MIPRAEAQAQLARLLGDEALRSAPVETARQAVHSRIEDLSEALVAEAAGSDDVFDHASALSYLQQRVEALAEVLDREDGAAVLQAARDRVEQW